MTGCAAFQATIDARLDGGPIDAAASAALDAHLAVCGACREREDGLRAVRDALRSLPVLALPDEALAEVWARTLGAPRGHEATGSAPYWRLAAVAAGVTLILLIPLVGRWRRDSVRADAAELARADREVKTVLAITSRAIRRSEEIARDEILVGQVSPAVRRIPIRWHKDDPSASRRSGT